MNKDAVAKIKNKIKKNAPDIILTATTLTVAAAALYIAKKHLSAMIEIELPRVDKETRETLMKDEDFNLFKLSDNEYLLAGPTPQ